MATLAQSADSALGEAALTGGMAAPGAAMPAAALSPAPTSAPSAAPTTAIAPLPPTALRSLAGLGGILEQPAVKKALPAILVLLVLAVAAGLYAWMQETPYRQVFPGMQEADQQAAMDVLKGANFNPRLDPGSGQLMVPANRYHEARMLLAAQGLPRAQGRGILDSLKDQSAMTTSQFMEQARYSAAIEQELARSIMQIGTIQGARVHLAQTRQSAFVRDRTPVKASVVVTPHAGRAVSPNQVQAIVHLVASSVPYLAVEDVSVVDNLGNLLTRAPNESALGLTTLQAQHKQQAEELYRSRIVQLLEPVVGEGNVRAQVDLTLDFNQVETASEDFDTAKLGPKTRSESLSEERGTVQDPQGVPGALSNTPPAVPTATTDTTASEEKRGNTPVTLNTKATRNFELDKTMRHVRSAPGSIVRVSAAVVIKERGAAVKDAPKEAGKDAAPGAAAPQPYSPEEVEQLTGLVKGVVGFRQDRGDVVSLLPARFEPANAAPAPPWYENDNIVNGIKLGIGVLVLLVILFAVVRPAIKTLAPPPPLAGLPAPGEGVAGALSAPTDGVPANITMEEGESLEEFKQRLKKAGAQKRSGISADMLDTANTYDDKVALIRMLVQEDSGRVASVLKSMIKRDLKI